MKNLKTDYLSLFEHICTIPHGSGNTKKIAEFCSDFALYYGCDAKIDNTGNVIIKCPASKGYEDHDTIILQGHTDMVCEKTLNSTHDFLNDPLNLIYEDGFLRADDTTLGGDDGIAVAYALSIIADKNLKHPPLEILLTADEETGLYGAIGFDGSTLKGRKMINIDSEEEGTLLSGCAGGLTADYCFEAEEFDTESVFLTVGINGLAGGHSGADIHKKRLNAIKALSFLCKEYIALGCRISEFNCGTKMNAIPFGGHIVLSVPDNKIDTIKENAVSYLYNIKSLCVSPDDRPELEYRFSKKQKGKVLNEADSLKLCSFINELPDGIVSYTDETQRLVKTSLNLGVLEYKNGNFNATALLRSSLNSDIDVLSETVTNLAKKHNIKVVFSDRYPAWEFKSDSALRNKMCEVYKALYGNKLKVDVIHAGLECGILSDKMPGLDCVSIGPNIHDIHTCQEKLDLASAERTYQFILKILEEM